MSVTIGETINQSRRSPFSEVREAARQRILLGTATAVGIACVPLIIGGTIMAAYYL